MSPLKLMVATVELELCQVMGRPVIGAPVESLRLAVACAVPPIKTDDGMITTATVAIGIGVGGITDIVA
jgi:hypothetical protein